MGHVHVCLLVLIVVLGGCATSPVETETPPTDPTTEPAPDVDSPTATQTDTRTRTPSPTPTETATPIPDRPDNPWQKEPVIIGIDNSADPDRNYTAPVLEAVDYWHANGEGYTAWESNFSVEPNADSPDIVIRFVNDIPACGPDESGVTIGCASLLYADSHPDDPEVVLVNLGLTDQSTYRVVRHELGHILGLEHGEGPSGVMAEYSEVFNQVVRVHFEFETRADHEKRDTRTQAGYAFDYYSSGAEGFLSEEVEFAVITDPEAADVIIQVNESGGDSRGYNEGDHVVIELNGIQTSHRGWHVGYWLGFYFGANATSELPPPFDEPESDPRSQWWH